tara:strand:+ start:911 stop:1591 length:681 start_codon:yes stop_codon:yes gene_type:complete
MLQLKDKKKIYLYLVFLFIFLSLHNINSINFINDSFKIKKITLESNLENKINNEISESLNEFYNSSIFSINTKKIQNILKNINIIGEYRIKKEYPSAIKIELKETKILAYYFDNNIKTYIGLNGKKIKNKIVKEDLPLIIGNVNVEIFLDLNDKLTKNGFKLNNFKKLYFFKSNRWDLLYQDKILIKLSNNNLDLSINLLKKILNRSLSNGVKIIDLRIKDKIILS